MNAPSLSFRFAMALYPAVVVAEQIGRGIARRYRKGKEDYFVFGRGNAPVIPGMRRLAQATMRNFAS